MIHGQLASKSRTSGYRLTSLSLRQLRHVNLWAQHRFAEQPHQVNRKILNYEPFPVEWHRKLDSTLIELEINDEGQPKKRRKKRRKKQLTCTVREALEHIKPGTFMIPAPDFEEVNKDPRPFILNHFKRQEHAPDQSLKEEDPRDYTKAAPKPYVLADLMHTKKTSQGGSPGGPWIIWSGFEDPMRMRALLTSAYNGLTYSGSCHFSLKARYQVRPHPTADDPNGHKVEVVKPDTASTHTREMLDWICQYMPHVWPPVLMQSMPEGTQMVLPPHSDGQELQFTFSRKISPDEKRSLKDISAKIRNKQSLAAEYAAQNGAQGSLDDRLRLKRSG